MKKYVCILFAFGIFLGCTNKKGKAPAPLEISPFAIVNCDTVNVGYECIVKPILEKNCYNCHSSLVTDTGNLALDIETFSSFKTYLKLFYKNDSIYGSKFYNTILQSPTTNRMPPPPYNKLQSFDLRMIKKWIDAGANQN